MSRSSTAISLPDRGRKKTPPDEGGADQSVGYPEINQTARTFCRFAVDI
jgi:hypothetical protein